MMTTLSLETYARILAHAACRRAARLDEIAKEFGVDLADLHTAETGLRQQLASAWQERKGIVAMKVAAALGSELLRLGQLGADGAPADAGMDASALASLSTGAVPQEPEVPTFLQATSAPRPGAPVVAGSEVAAPPVPTSVPEPAPVPHLKGTVDMDLSAVVAAVRQGALPFKPGESQASSTAAKPDVTRVDAPSSTMRLGGTVDADLSAVVAAVKRGPLPFAPGRETSPGTGTEADAGAGSASLPLETYASVTGALARGEARESVLTRHGLDAEGFDKLAKAWAQRFAREPHLLARFHELARSNAAGPRGGA